ncbi:hypothetical protein OSB04_031900 [Centaurea solstitialis]|uniref:CCHC-type domain-containing protein n=1 Tax=Centaurea solstitialis TaxID=347529 RepID=A0AA38VUT8_9ASTR|nr:hypothetical protein OSB04_031900 [Centaurea solstitialis]
MIFTAPTTASDNISNKNSSASQESNGDAVLEAFLASHVKSALINDDLEQISADDLEEMDIKWQMAMLTMRMKRFIRRTGRNNFEAKRGDQGGFENSKVRCYKCNELGHFARECKGGPSNPQGTGSGSSQSSRFNNRENNTSSSQALVSQEGLGFDWSDQAEEAVQNQALMAEIRETEIPSECEEGTGTAKDDLEKFSKSSKALESILRAQVNDDLKRGIGYNNTPPPYNQNYIPPTTDLLDRMDRGELKEGLDRVDPVETEEESDEKSTTETIPDENHILTNEKGGMPFVPSKKVDTSRKEKGKEIVSSKKDKGKKKETFRKDRREHFTQKTVVYPSTSSQSQNKDKPRGNKRNWNNQWAKSHGVDLSKINRPKTCFICCKLNHLARDCYFNPIHQRNIFQRSNSAWIGRKQQQSSAKRFEPANKRFVPQQNRPIQPKRKVQKKKVEKKSVKMQQTPATISVFTEQQSPAKTHFRPPPPSPSSPATNSSNKPRQQSPFSPRNNLRFHRATISGEDPLPATTTISIFSGNNLCIHRATISGEDPLQDPLPATTTISGKNISGGEELEGGGVVGGEGVEREVRRKMVAGVGEASEKGRQRGSPEKGRRWENRCHSNQGRMSSLWHVDSGCSRHMTGIMSLLENFKRFEGGHVAFGDNPKRGKISGKGKVSKGKMTFDDVYFMEQLRYNLLSVSQVYDKKFGVFFTDTECLILAPGFKIDESQVMLRTPRKDNVYCLDIEDASSISSLNCLFSKASVSESSLWHRRMCHMNFKNMNLLVKNNLVRVITSSSTEKIQETSPPFVMFPMPSVDPIEPCTSDDLEPVQEKEDDSVEKNDDQQTEEISTTDSTALSPSFEVEPVEPQGSNISDIELDVNDSNLGVNLPEEPLHLTRTRKNHPPSLVIGDIQSPMITRKQSKAITDPHSGMISVFLSQT